MSLVCVDELELHKDINRHVKHEIPRVVLDVFNPDPTFKAVSINIRRADNSELVNRKSDTNAPQTTITHITPT